MIEVDVDLDNAVADGIASANDSSGTTVALNGSLTSGGSYTSADGHGHIIIITDESTDTQTDVTFTITGTNENGDVISDTITGPASGATVASALFFKTVTAVTVSAAQGGSETVDIGTRNTTLAATSKVIPLNHRAHTAPQISVEVTGTMNFDVLETFDEVMGDTSTTRLFYSISALASKTASTHSQISVGATGVRLEINTYSDGAEAQMRIIQSDNS